MVHVRLLCLVVFLAGALSSPCFAQQPGLPPGQDSALPPRPRKSPRVGLFKQSYELRSIKDPGNGELVIAVGPVNLDPAGVSFQAIEMLAISRRVPNASTGKPAVGLLLTFTSYAPFTWSRQENRAFVITSEERRIELGQLELVKSSERSETSREQLGVAIPAESFIRIFADVVRRDEATLHIGEFKFRLVREHVRGLRRLADEVAK